MFGYINRKSGLTGGWPHFVKPSTFANVRELLLSAWSSVTLPPELAHIRDFDEWQRFILSQGKNQQGEDYWHVYFARATKNAYQTAKYLGRYLKKPPVAGSRLAHYDGSSRLSLRFLDHRTGHYDTLTLSPRELILRLIKHIPEKHFRMIRYFGFLANRKVGELLPQVRKALGQETVPEAKKVTYRSMYQRLLHIDPMKCILCGGRMVYQQTLKGLRAGELVINALAIARMRCVM